MTPMFLAAEHPPVDCSLGRSNRAVAWTGFCLGAGSGMIMGLWAFDGPLSPPAGFVDYGDTSRRLLRLGHIGFFGIGYLNLLLAWDLPSLGLGQRAKQVAARCMNFANLFLPLTLMAAAAYQPFKYLLPVPATVRSGRGDVRPADEVESTAASVCCHCGNSPSRSIRSSTV